MAAPVNANINVLVNTQQAMAQLRALQGQVATLNSSISATSGAAAAQQAALAKGLKDSANASRMWQARIVPMNTATQQFSDALDKGRMSLGQYTRFAASQLPGMSRVFKREFEMMNRVATQNVRQMQTQYLELGRSATGAAQAMAMTPTALNKHASAAAVAAQRQMMMNRMIDLGTTKLLNWGKNTQWAGRQLMVGFSIPLAMVGAVAAKAFKEIDKGSIAFRRVYGDLSTTTAEMERNLDAVKALGNEYTKYGLKLADTIELAADVAATGAKNESLLAATEQTLRLATLGLMEYGEALEATVALQTAFQVSNEDLASTIDFLNVVENETILTMQDMAAAIPRVAPVVKGLGGDVRDLAVFMTAMREGGVTAEQGANALKSGLGRLINPTKAAREVMAEFGMSIDAIIQSNRGDLMGMMQDFGQALATLGDFEQQQVLEKVFGKYQYARLGALFKNLANDASQANRTIELTNMSMEDLASISERELGKIEEATSTKFQAAVERLKVSIAPVGEQFMKALMPVIDFVTKIANKFNDLPDSIKNAIAIGVAAIAGIGPIVLMTIGLIANGIANIGKLIQTIRKFFARLRGDSQLFDYLTQQEREAATAANALSGATDNLTGKFLGQRRALESLTVMVGRYAGALASAAAAAPVGFGMGTAAAVRNATARGTTVTGPRTGGTTVVGPGGLRMATGGVVPGTGNKDTVPAMLTPGESVVTKEATQKYGPMIQAMNAGVKIPGFVTGVVNIGGGSAMRTVSMQSFSNRSTQTMQNQIDRVIRELVQDGVQMDQAIDRVTAAVTRYAQMMEAAGKKASGKTLSPYLAQEGLTRSSRTLVAAHLTGGISGNDPRVMQALSGHSQALRDWVRANPQYVQATSKLTATLPALLNQQLARGGATFRQFRQGWRMGGKDKLLNAAAMTDDTIKGDAEAGKALRKMAGDIGRKAIRIAKAEGAQKVTDAHLTRATQEVTEKYKGMGGSAAKAAAALDRAATQIGQIRIQMPKAVVQQGLRPGGDLVQQGRSVVTRAGGIEVARDRGARGASNIPIAGGLATATARQQTEILNKVMAANGPIAAAAYFSTNTPAMVSGTTAMAQQVAQTQNRVIEANTQDIAKLARDRNSPYKTVGPDAQSDAQKYINTVKQTLASMTPIKTGKPLVQANLPQGTKLPGAGTGQAFNPANNPKNLGGPRTPIVMGTRAPMLAIESRQAIDRRKEAEERRLQQEEKKFKVTDNRRTTAVEKQIPIIGQQTSWMEKSIQSQQALERQRQLNITATEQANQAQLRANGALQRQAVAVATASQVPARGGILDKPIGALRRYAFPGGQDASLKNLGFNQFTGQMKTAGQLIVEAAKGAKTRIVADTKVFAQGYRDALRLMVQDSKWAGGSLKTEMTALGRVIKTNMQVDLDTVKRSVTNTATALGRLATSAGNAAQRMAGGVSTWMNTVDKNGTTRMQKFGQASNGAVMGLMGVSMAASFAGGNVGEMAQKIMPVTMGLMGLQMILPMFKSKMGLLLLAVIAITGSMIYAQNKMKELAKNAAEVGANLGGVANSLKIIEEATGFAAPSQKDRLFRFSDEDRKAMSEFSSYFESEAGSKFIKDLREATSEERYQKVSYLLAQAIGSGMEEEKAKSFGQAIAMELGDSLLNSSIARDFANNVFEYGSQALIDLEKRRLESAPELEITMSPLAGDTTMEQLYQGDPGLRGRRSRLDDLLAAIVPGAGRLERNLESAYKNLGFISQQLANLSNAEAVLYDERAKGLINYEESLKQEKEINRLREQAGQQLYDLFSVVGSSAPDIRAAFEDQLKGVGFEDGDITKLLDKIAPEDLAQQIFDESYFKLDEQQRKYIDEVFSRTISGITPENMSQRLQDINSVYTQIAEEVVDAMTSGTFTGIEDYFNVENITNWLEENMGGDFGFGSKRVPASALAENLIESQPELEKMGTNLLEVQTILNKFSNQQFAKSLLKTEEDILRLGEAITKLSDYDQIDIEFVLKENIDPDQIIYAIEALKNIKFDKDLFGNAGYDADYLVQKMMELGYSAMEIPGQVRNGVFEATTVIKQLEKDGEKAFNKLGNIKITPQIVTKILDLGEADNAQGISAKLAEVFPNELPTSILPIMIQLLGTEQLAALSGMVPGMLDALTQNPALKEYTVSSPYGGVTYEITEAQKQAASVIGLLKDLQGPEGRPPKNELDGAKDTTGGGSKEKSFLEQTMEDLEANASLYLTTQRAAKKYGKTKADFFGVFQELRRKFGVPEGFIASLGTGIEAVQKAIEFMEASKKERKRLIELYKETSVGEQIENLRKQREERKAKVEAITILTANGISLEDAKKAAEDSKLAMDIVAAAAKGNKEQLNTLLGLIKTEVIPEEEAKDPLDALSERISQINDLMGQAFDAAEIEAADGVAKKFFDDNTTLAQKLAKSTGHTIENGYQLAEAMERQVSLNERLINQEQEKIDAKQEEISDYERSNQLIQQGIDDLKREDEIRNRRSEGLSRDLEQIAKAEEEIRKSYQDRIDALDKVAKVNEHLIQQQQKQLNLSRAISEGDIYAATQAAQEMRAASAQQAVEQRRLALEQGMEGAIAGLTSAEGMTRAEIEEEINNIKEQNYQNSLLIRIEEDKIYANSLEIRRLSNEIYDIQENLIEPLENQNKEYSRMLDYYKEDADYQISRVTLAGMTREQFEKQADALGLAIKNAQDLDPELKALVGDYNAIATAANAAAAAAAKLGVKMATSQFSGQVTGTPSAAPAGGSIDLSGLTADMFGGIDFSNLDLGGLNLGLSFNNAGGLIKKYAQGGMVNPLKYTSNEPPPAQKRASGGMVFGEGARDSVAAMLTPGEFVIRKAMVDKYGLPLMKALNQGSFAMPTYETGMQTPEMGVVANNMVSNINAPVYNTYDMKFSISGSNQSADEIANKVMFKMQQIQNQGIRNNRGY